MAANPSSPSAGGGMSASSPTLPPVRLAAAQAASAAAAIHPTSARYFFSSLAGTNASPHRRIAIAVDLSDESAYAVRWAVQNYLRPGDAVVLLHVRPTSVLYGADWGSIPVSVSDDADGKELQKKREEDCDGGGARLLAAAAARSAGYRAPEAPPPPRPWASQKGDVYAFGRGKIVRSEVKKI